MQRREFITLIGGAAAAWPMAVRAQQPVQIRGIGMLLNRTADDPEGQAGIAAFQQALQQFGWTEGTNLRFDIRWGQDDVDHERRSVKRSRSNPSTFGPFAFG